jgi:hypothetical protein
VDTLETRQLLSVAVVDVLNKSSYTITADFRWTPSSSWSQFKEAPGQGEIFWTSYSTTLSPQVLYNNSTASTSQVTNSLAQGYGEYGGTGTPPTSAASLYEFLNTSTGLQLYFGASPQTTAIVQPTAASGSNYIPAYGPLFAGSGPSYTDVRQGSAGDCWLLSSLAEVAARDPQDIRNMFTYDGTTIDNGSSVGLYTVRFYNAAGTAEYVNVDTELPSGPFNGYNYDQPNGDLWVALAEKAYAEAAGIGFVTSSNPSNSYTALNSGSPTWALQAITGKSANQFSINPTNIAAAWNAGELIVLGTGSPSSSYIVGGHAYAVVGYNPSSSMPFELFNPWGTTASGYAPDLENGHQVYGLFFANASFVSQNFISQNFGSGSAVELKAIDDVPVEPDGGAIQAPVISLSPKLSESLKKVTVLGTPSDNLVTMNHQFFKKSALPAQV